jgi:acetate kinase
MINKKVIVINGGSNTIKFKTFDYNTLNVVCSGACKRITVDGVFTLKINGKVIDEKADFTTFNKAIKYLVNAFKKYGLIANSADIIAFGHRIVRGSSENDKAQVINKKVFNDIKKNCFTAPLHNKPELVVIKAFKDVLPTSKHVAVFDSAFHLTMPKLNYFYPVEKKLREKYDIRRYGAHGTSYKYITAKMQGILKKKENNLIICHLGSGCSICAIKDSKSYDTSMGYTPLEGLLMSTRCGNIDGGIILDLTQNGIKPENLNNLLNKESG